MSSIAKQQLISKGWRGCWFITAWIVLVLVFARNVVVLHGMAQLKNAAADGAFVLRGSTSTKPGTPSSSFVLSFSLYDNNQRQQFDGIYKAASDAPAIYPGWQVRIYHSSDIEPSILTSLAKLGPHVKLANITELPDWALYQNVDPLVWSFLVASDPTVEAYAIRSADSALSIREKAAVEEWLASGRAFHIMRDHPLHHPMRDAIRPGMWGGLHTAVPQMSQLLTRFYAEKEAPAPQRNDRDAHTHAQTFLWENILPLAKNNCLQHDSYYCGETGGIAFPMTRVKAGAPHDFIGDIYTNIGRGGTGRTPKSLPDLQKCLIIEKSRSKYMTCLRQRYDATHDVVGNVTTMIPDSTYIGPMRPHPQQQLDAIAATACKPDHDDEFYSLDQPDSMEHLQAISGLAGGKLGGKVSKIDSIQRQLKGSYRFWSSDFHIAPIADVKDLFKSWPRTRDYFIIDESGSGHCELKDTCASNLRVINRENGVDLGPCPNELKREFWREYAHDQRMNSIDAFFCHHATGLCEIFMPFGRPMIAIVSTRYEIGRTSAPAWSRLNANLIAIASNPRNTIAANNRYDAEYVKHFTGLKEVKVVPNFCGYIKDKYNPTQPEVLIGPGRMSIPGKMLCDQLKMIGAAKAQTGRSLLNKKVGSSNGGKNSSLSLPLRFVSIREKYGRFKYSDLASHPAIVLIPYQVSIMSVFEYYRMGIPLFAPSPNLLAKWQFERTIMKELTWSCVSKECDKKSSIGGHPDSPHGNRDPNDMSSIENIAYWIKFADFYHLPEITLYENWNDLYMKILQADLGEIHKRMMAFNVVQKEKIYTEWGDILDRAFSNTTPRWQAMKDAPLRTNNNDDMGDELLQMSWEEAVLRNYPTTAQHTHVTC